MTSTLPPDPPNFSGINYNSSFWSNASTTGLTYNQALKNFLTFPTAQGSETLQNTSVNGTLTLINTTTPTETYSQYVDPSPLYDMTLSTTQNNGGLTIRTPLNSFTMNPNTFNQNLVTPTPVIGVQLLNPINMNNFNILNMGQYSTGYTQALNTNLDYLATCNYVNNMIVNGNGILDNNNLWTGLNNFNANGDGQITTDHGLTLMYNNQVGQAESDIVCINNTSNYGLNIYAEKTQVINTSIPKITVFNDNSNTVFNTGATVNGNVTFINGTNNSSIKQNVNELTINSNSSYINIATGQLAVQNTITATQTNLNGANYFATTAGGGPQLGIISNCGDGAYGSLCQAGDCQIYFTASTPANPNTGGLTIQGYGNTTGLGLRMDNDANTLTLYGLTCAAPTPTTGDNSTKIATTAYVTTAINNVPGGINYETHNNIFTGTNTFQNTVSLGSSATVTTQATPTNNTSVASTQFVYNALATISSATTYSLATYNVSTISAFTYTNIRQITSQTSNSYSFPQITTTSNPIGGYVSFTLFFSTDIYPTGKTPNLQVGSFMSILNTSNNTSFNLSITIPAQRQMTFTSNSTLFVASSATLSGIVTYYWT